MVDYPIFSLLLSTWFFVLRGFCVEGVILSLSYSLSFHVRGSFMP